jgi:hypothetical protein
MSFSGLVEGAHVLILGFHCLETVDNWVVTQPREDLLCEVRTMRKKGIGRRVALKENT